MLNPVTGEDFRKYTAEIRFLPIPQRMKLDNVRADDSILTTKSGSPTPRPVTIFIS